MSVPLSARAGNGAAMRSRAGHASHGPSRGQAALSRGWSAEVAGLPREALAPPTAVSCVHGRELGGRHAVAVSAVAIVVDEVVSLAIAGRSLLRFDATGFRGNLCPHRRLLHIAAPTYLLVRPRKDLAGHRVDIAVVVDQPVA